MTRQGEQLPVQQWGEEAEVDQSVQQRGEKADGEQLGDDEGDAGVGGETAGEGADEEDIPDPSMAGIESGDPPSSSRFRLRKCNLVRARPSEHNRRLIKPRGEWKWEDLDWDAQRSTGYWGPCAATTTLALSWSMGRNKLQGAGNIEV